MKRIFALVIVAVSLSSCSMPAYTKFYQTDFTRYAKDGMYVTPFADYSGHAYSPVSDFTIEHFIGGMGQESTDFQEMADVLVDAAKSVGANGIMNFKVQRSQYTWYASGTAVVFHDMPNKYVLPTTTAVAKDGVTVENAIPQYEGDELIAQTVRYCLNNKIQPFSCDKDWNDTVYDLNIRRFIPEDMYKQKYGENSVVALQKALTKALRGNKK